MEKLLKMSLEEIYLEYVNDFLTLEQMAECYGVSEKFMTTLYTSAKVLRDKVYK